MHSPSTAGGQQQRAATKAVFSAVHGDITPRRPRWYGVAVKYGCADRQTMIFITCTNKAEVM